MLDIRQTLAFANYLKREGWIVKRIDGVNYFLRKLPLIGYILKIQRPIKIDFDCISVLVRQYKVFQVIVEPNDETQIKELLKSGYKLTKSTYLPSKTLQIDLSQSKEEIFSHFKKDTHSTLLRAMARSTGGGHKITTHQYSTDKEIKIFRNSWKKSVKFNRYVPSVKQLINLKKSFPQSKSLFLASHNISGRIIGGVIFTTSFHKRSNYITYYWHAFTNKEGRTLLSQCSLLYYGILWAKKHGYKLFDFEGIYDERFPNKNWLGFTHFKKSFGGKEVLYPGCYCKTLHSILQLKPCK